MAFDPRIKPMLTTFFFSEVDLWCSLFSLFLYIACHPSVSGYMTTFHHDNNNNNNNNNDNDNKNKDNKNKDTNKNNSQPKNLSPSKSRKHYLLFLL